MNNKRNRETIMIIEDDLLNQSLLTHMLGDTFTVKVVSVGEEGLVTAQKEQIDLILLDAVLPDMDGFEVCRQLKASAQTANIPVIFVSALSQAGDLARARNVGAVDFIRKPFSPNAVMARIRTHLTLQMVHPRHIVD